MGGAILIRVPNLVEDDYDRRGDTDEINVFGWLWFRRHRDADECVAM